MSRCIAALTLRTALAIGAGLLPMLLVSAGTSAPCNYAVDAENKANMIRGGDYFAGSVPASGTATAEGCAALCCATDGCQAFSLNVPWSMGQSN